MANGRLSVTGSWDPICVDAAQDIRDPLDGIVDRASVETF
jgi:hypothetical protein